MLAGILAVDEYFSVIADGFEPHEHAFVLAGRGKIEVAAVGRLVNAPQTGDSVPTSRHGDVALLASGRLEAPRAVQRNHGLFRR